MNTAQLHPLVKEEVFARLPALKSTDSLFPRLKKAVRESSRKVVVLDDDPTGSQTVHGIDVLTGWAVEDLQRALLGEGKVFFILTNSRSLDAARACALNAEIGRNLCQASRICGIEFDVISRGDSTLRGHYPDELDVLEEVLNQEAGITFDGQLLIPAFFEGGRFTIDDVHYVQEKSQLIPAGETEFAKDPVFGYRHSRLDRYIEEKTAGRYLASDVVRVSLADLREGGGERVRDLLLAVSGGKKIIVNAAAYSDLQIFVLGLLQAEQAGKRFSVRSSASFVKVRGAVTDRPYLAFKDIQQTAEPGHGGLVVVGSYIGKTSAQVETAKQLDGLRTLEIEVPRLLDEPSRAAVLEEASRRIQQAISQGIDIMVYTSRTQVKSHNGRSSIDIGKAVSSALVEVVRSLPIAPGFLIAKGGITSSDLATEALGVKSARVLGQVAPGISAWQLGDETRFPGIAYVVFPGNVGSDETLAGVISQLSGR